MTKLNRRARPLVYSTYLGGSGIDDRRWHRRGHRRQRLRDGLHVSPTSRPRPGASDDPRRWPDDAFVTKLNPTGTALVYSTYLGGIGDESVGYGIAVDTAGNAYVTGYTASNNFPTYARVPFRRQRRDAFVTKLNPAGSALAYSTYLGGSWR